MRNPQIFLFRALFAIPLLCGVSPLGLASTGDIDGDGDVDGADMLAAVGCLQGPMTPVGGGCTVFDQDDNATVDLADLLRLQDKFSGDGPLLGTFPADWISGCSPCSGCGDPAIQVHRYNQNTWILRQSKCVNFEGPFMYLLFGEDRVLMLDSGATSSAAQFPIGSTVQGIINQYLAETGLASIEIILVHSHGHGDHVQGDAQINALPNSTVVGTSLTALQNFFGITSWPTQVVQYDLGGRVLDVFGIPGHHSAHIAIYDRQTDILLTGDTLYPGHLFISTWSQWRTSIFRLADWARTHHVQWILGTHIEMTSTPGVAYPYGTVFQPNEHVLQLLPEHLFDLEAGIAPFVSPPPNDLVFDHFIAEP